jgi:hypothetical protein
MISKITGKSVVKFVGWAAIFATTLLILVKAVFNLQIPMIGVLLGLSSGTFCLYLGYSHEDSKK